MKYTGTLTIFVEEDSYSIICRKEGGFRVLQERSSLDKSFDTFLSAYAFVLERIKIHD